MFVIILSGCKGVYSFVCVSYTKVAEPPAGTVNPVTVSVFPEVTVGDGMPPASPHDDDIPNGFHRDDQDEIPF